MMRKVFLPILLVGFMVTAAGATRQPVSEHYFVDEYVAMKAYHQKVGKLVMEDPSDQNLLGFSLDLLKNDLTAFQNMTPPENFQEMHTRVVAAIRAHIQAIQYAQQGDKKKAKRLWNRGDSDLQWVDAFLMQRDWEIDEIPLVSPMFKPTDAQLTDAQYTDRYFLIRVLNQKIGTALAQEFAKKKGGAGLDHTARMLDAEIKAWKATRYPEKMKGIHAQVLQALEASSEWVIQVKAGKTGEAKKTADRIDALYKQVDDDLKKNFNIQVPDFVEKPG